MTTMVTMSSHEDTDSDNCFLNGFVASPFVSNDWVQDFRPNHGDIDFQKGHMFWRPDSNNSSGASSFNDSAKANSPLDARNIPYFANNANEVVQLKKKLDKVNTDWIKEYKNNLGVPSGRSMNSTTTCPRYNTIESFSFRKPLNTALSCLSSSSSSSQPSMSWSSLPVASVDQHSALMTPFMDAKLDTGFRVSSIASSTTALGVAKNVAENVASNVSDVTADAIVENTAQSIADSVDDVADNLSIFNPSHALEPACILAPVDTGCIASVEADSSPVAVISALTQKHRIEAKRPRRATKPTKKSRMSSPFIKIYKTPSATDILPGRGSGSNKHKGNVEFLAKALELSKKYRSVTATEHIRKDLRRALVEWVQKERKGQFLQLDEEMPGKKKWYIKPQSKALSKAGQVLREYGMKKKPGGTKHAL